LKDEAIFLNPWLRMCVPLAKSIFKVEVVSELLGHFYDEAGIEPAVAIEIVRKKETKNRKQKRHKHKQRCRNQ
jgi:hypothetical protein